MKYPASGENAGRGDSTGEGGGVSTGSSFRKPIRLTLGTEKRMLPLDSGCQFSHREKGVFTWTISVKED